MKRNIFALMIVAITFVMACVVPTSESEKTGRKQQAWAGTPSVPLTGVLVPRLASLSSDLGGCTYSSGDWAFTCSGTLKYLAIENDSYGRTSARWGIATSTLSADYPTFYVSSTVATILLSGSYCAGQKTYTYGGTHYKLKNTAGMPTAYSVTGGSC